MKMTKDEAIELLEDLDGAIEDNHGRDYDEAFRMAIEALSAEPSKSADQNVENVPSGDTISRADAIEAGNKIVEELALSSLDWDDLKYWAKELFDALPSADRPRGEWMSDETVPIEDVWQGVQPLKDKILELEEKLYLQNEKQKAQTINWSHDQISRAEVLALINKAMYNTDNKDIQDYLFCGLRRDVHHLPSADRPQVNSNSAEEQIAETCDRPKGEWVTDTTPTEEGFYLVTIEGIYGNLVRIMCRRKEYWCEFDDERGDIAYGDDEIFAWRPLPKPYSADRPQADPEPAPVVAYICDRRRCAICRGPDGGCDHTTDIKHAAHFKNVAGQYFERPYMEEEDDG